VIDLKRVVGARIEMEPYRWAAIGDLFSPDDAAALAATFPHDHFKHLAGDDGDKEYEYEIRCLVRMGEQSISRAGRLSSAWRSLAHDLLSPAYRSAMSSLTGLDLSAAPLEVNAFHYAAGTNHGAHPDHRSKIVTHVIYFNESWSEGDGGCLLILGSRDPEDVAATVSPRVGNSAVLVRSDNSWHAVSRVADHCALSRRSVTATFYQPGSVSTVWPRWDRALVHGYASRWQRLRRVLQRAE
jgi:hypothetical protein